MQRKFPVSALLGTLFLTLMMAVCGPLVRAAETDATASANAALELLPAETLAATVVPQINILDTKLSGLGGPLQMLIPLPITLGRSMIGLREGLQEDGAVVVALVGPVKDDSHLGTPLGIVATSNYQKLIGQYSPKDQGQGISLVTLPHQKLYVAQMKNFALFVQGSDEDRKLLERLLQTPPTAAHNPVGPLQSWLVQQDLAVFTTASGTKALLEHAKSSLDSLKSDSDADSTAQMKSFLTRLVAVVQKETSQIGVGLRIDDDHNLHLAARTLLISDGELSKTAASLPPSIDKPLVGLPTGPFLVALDGSTSEKLNDWLAAFNLNNLKDKASKQPNSNISDDDWKKLSDALNQTMQGDKSMAFVMGVPPQGKSVFSKMFALLRVDNSQTFMQHYETSMNSYATQLKSLHNAALPEYEINQVDVDGTPTFEVSVDMSAMLKNAQQQNPGAPQAMAFTQMLFGNDGRLTVRIAPVDSTTVVMAWGEPESLKTAIEAAKSPDTSLGADVDVKTTIALMPKNAQWRGFLSPSGYLEFVKSMMQMMMPQMPFQLPSFPNTPDIGFTVKFDPQNVDAEILVPAGVLEGIGTYKQQLQHTGP